MIIFIYGPDTYRSHNKLNEIVNHYKKIHKGGLNLKIFDENNLDFQKFQREIEIVSMLREKKLIILKDIFLNNDFQEKFLKQGKKLTDSEDIILIYEKGKINEKSPFFLFLKKNSKWQEFQFLNEEKLKIWLKKEFAKYNTEVDSKALESLIHYVGNDLWQMENEVKKLINYKNRQKIKREDIGLLVKPKTEVDIFKTIEAISKKEKNRALFLIRQHLEKGASPLYLLSMINFQFRNLLIVKSFEKSSGIYPYDIQILSKKLGIHPYVIKKALFLAKKFDLEELKRIYKKIFETDWQIKTGKLVPEMALDLLITKI